jgi:biopolymer transport protein ExbD
LLLIFFLVASTPDETSKIDLPEARYGKGVSERESIIFSVAEGGIDMAPVFLGDGRIPANQIPGTAKEQADQIEKEVRKALNEERPRQHVLIKAEKGVPHREVARVTAAASRVAGIHLHFAVMEPN